MLVPAEYSAVRKCRTSCVGEFKMNKTIFIVLLLPVLGLCGIINGLYSFYTDDCLIVIYDSINYVVPDVYGWVYFLSFYFFFISLILPMGYLYINDFEFLLEPINYEESENYWSKKPSRIRNKKGKAIVLLMFFFPVLFLLVALITCFRISLY